MPKKQKKAVAGNQGKPLQKAINAIKPGLNIPDENLEMTPEFIAGIIADIANSPIDENYKAVFLYAIAKGTFNLELYQLYITMLGDVRKAMEQHANELQTEIQALEDQTQKLGVELGKSAVKGCKEWEAAVDHFEQETMQTIEKTAKSAEQKKIVTIQEKFKKNKS